MVKVIDEELKYDGVSVVIARRECVTELAHRKKLELKAKKKDS